MTDPGHRKGHLALYREPYKGIRPPPHLRGTYVDLAIEAMHTNGKLEGSLSYWSMMTGIPVSTLDDHIKQLQKLVRVKYTPAKSKHEQSVLVILDYAEVFGRRKTIDKPPTPRPRSSAVKEVEDHRKRREEEKEFAEGGGIMGAAEEALGIPLAKFREMPKEVRDAWIALPAEERSRLIAGGDE
jgi:hypothetical protein